MALLFTSANLRGAGVYNALATTPATQFLASAPFAAGQPLVGSGNGSGSDSFSVRFTAAGSNAFQGCSAQLTANDVYTEVFAVAGGYLTCTETDNTAGVGPTTVNLVSGVSGMNVLYGVDTTGDGSADEYLTGDQVTTATLWRAVLTIQVTLIFTNPLAGQPGQPATVSLTQTVLYLGSKTW
jgi:type IV pilus assembly protein PilW